MKQISPIDAGQIIHEITPLSEKDCFYIADRRKSEFTFPLHTHSECELNFIENGRGLKRIVGDSEEEVPDFDLMLLTSPDLEHAWEQGSCTSPEIREVTIQFSSDAFFESMLDKNQFATIEKMLDKAQNGLVFPLKAIMKVYKLLDTLSDTEGFYGVLNFLTLLYELSLFTDEARQLSSSSFAKIEAHSDSRRVQRVQNYINHNYKEDIRLSDLAELVGMTNESFSRFFKLRTGRSLSDYIIDIRLGHATRMLIDTTKLISEICYESGFNNLSNFNRIFKKRKGCSPKVFRENFRKKKILV